MWFRNPILEREFRANARSRKAVAFAVVLMGVLSLVLIGFWPRTGLLSDAGTSELFGVLAGTYLALVLMITPGFTATAITDERENNSFDLLFTTLLSPAEILAGKLLAPLGMTALLLAVSMPIGAVCALSGGISPGLLGRAYAVIALAAAGAGLLGLAVSACCRRSSSALLVTYMLVVGLAGATWLPSVLLGQFESLVPVWRWLRTLSPFEALYALNCADRYELAVTGLAAPDVYRLHISLNACLAVLWLGLFCFFVLRPPRSRRGREQRQYSDTRTAIRRTLAFPFYLIDPLRRRRPLPLYRNPVFVAELRSKVFGHPKFIARGLSACIVLSLLLLTFIAEGLGGSLEPEQVRLPAILFQVGLVALLAPAVSSGSITDERVSGTFLLLRLTPLPAWRVVSGKLKAAFLYVILFVISGLPVLFALAYLESRVAYWRVGAWVAVLLLSAVVFIAAGLCASTFAASTPVATAVSYGFSASVCLGTLGVLLIGNRASPALQAAVLSLNPCVAALQVTSDTMFARLPTLFGLRLWQLHLVVFGVLAVALVVVAGLRVRALCRERT